MSVRTVSIRFFFIMIMDLPGQPGTTCSIFQY
jgi:hypothetical protein